MHSILPPGGIQVIPVCASHRVQASGLAQTVESLCYAVSMEISVILAHPERRSFNHAIALAACRTLSAAGTPVRFHI